MLLIGRDAKNTKNQEAEFSAAVPYSLFSVFILRGMKRMLGRRVAGGIFLWRCFA